MSPELVSHRNSLRGASQIYIKILTGDPCRRPGDRGGGASPFGGGVGKCGATPTIGGGGPGFIISNSRLIIITITIIIIIITTIIIIVIIIIIIIIVIVITITIIIIIVVIVTGCSGRAMPGWASLHPQCVPPRVFTPGSVLDYGRPRGQQGQAYRPVKQGSCEFFAHLFLSRRRY